MSLGLAVPMVAEGSTPCPSSPGGAALALLVLGQRIALRAVRGIRRRRLVAGPGSALTRDGHNDALEEKGRDQHPKDDVGSADELAQTGDLPSFLKQVGPW